MNLKTAVAVYNTVPNVIWSILNFLPVFIFCYRFVDLRFLFVFLLFSGFTVLLPRTFYESIQLSSAPRAYKSLGVHWVNKFTQNGEVINRLLRKRFPEYKVVSIRTSSINRLIAQTYMFEKFHFMLFTFFTMVTCMAIVIREPGWALIITITNIIYNVYPCLLQQYIRLKLLNFKKNNLEKI